MNKLILVHIRKAFLFPLQFISFIVRYKRNIILQRMVAYIVHMVKPLPSNLKASGQSTALLRYAQLCDLPFPPKLTQLSIRSRSVPRIKDSAGS